MSWLLKGTLLVDNPQPLAKASAGNMPSEIAPRRGLGSMAQKPSNKHVATSLGNNSNTVAMPKRSKRRSKRRAALSRIS